MLYTTVKKLTPSINRTIECPQKYTFFPFFLIIGYKTDKNSNLSCSTRNIVDNIQCWLCSKDYLMRKTQYRC